MGRPCELSPKGQCVAGNPRTLNMPVYEKLNGFTSGSLWYGAGIGCVGYRSTPSFPSISCEGEHYQTNITSLPQLLINRKFFCFIRTECKIIFPVYWSLDKKNSLTLMNIPQFT